MQACLMKLRKYDLRFLFLLKARWEHIKRTCDEEMGLRYIHMLPYVHYSLQTASEVTSNLIFEISSLVYLC